MTNIHTFDPHTSGSKGLVYIGDKLLLYRRDTRTTNHPLEIDLPGGGMEGRETPWQTFQREVKEEFGLDILPEQVTYSDDWPIPSNPSLTGYFMVIKLPASAANDIVFGNEGLEYLLMTPAEYLAAPDAWPSIRDHARIYLESIGPNPRARPAA